MNNNEIAAAYEELDKINGTFHKSLESFEKKMDLEIAELSKLLDGIKANWTGSIRDSFVNNYMKKEEKLRECLERITTLKQLIAQVKEKIAAALDVLRSSAE